MADAQVATDALRALEELAEAAGRFGVGLDPEDVADLVADVQAAIAGGALPSIHEQSCAHCGDRGENTLQGWRHFQEWMKPGGYNHPYQEPGSVPGTGDEATSRSVPENTSDEGKRS